VVYAQDARSATVLKATPKAVTWGYYVTKAALALHLKSGDDTSWIT
jgi:hypothetical protein